MGVQPIIGYNFGARLYARVRKTILIAIAGASTFAFICYVGIQLFPKAFVALFAGPRSENLDIGVYALRHYFFVLPLVGFQVLGAGYFQATGKPVKSLILGLSRQFIILVPLLYILPLFSGLDGVWNAQPIADALSSVLTVCFIGYEIRNLSKQEPMPGPF
jgi:Na+-driven multidrug efflux pump